ncbi:C-type lectin domain family 4 member A-like isoform X2 [Carassius gibelio]|uniref:C-type lectin domain family 4 member A-like isoform X2 n=1 Tax=Carassius gibelio TaxID=101364 RepID=UPI0022777DBA|nr:C-type lectin domain family 4 member A-like isoform X2 [Carassius gibelio]
MSDDIHDNVIGTEFERMIKDRVDITVVNYESVDCVRDCDFRRQTKTLQPLQQTGSDSVKTRISRAAVVCLVLLCVLLLTAVIVLCVHIHTKNTNYTEKIHQLLTNNTNLTEERDELIKKIRNVLNQLSIPDGWIYYQSSFYYMSNETRNWTESSKDCQKRGADLIIINTREEQDFAKKITAKREFWIGLTDSEVEGTWKWVDGSTLTYEFWERETKEPNGGTLENCVVTYLTKVPQLKGWLDNTCNGPHQWICEKNISPLIQQ